MMSYPTGGWPRRSVIRRYLYWKFRGVCQICHQEVPSFKEATADHIIPLRHNGPPSHPANLRLACRVCNNERGAASKTWKREAVAVRDAIAASGPSPWTDAFELARRAGWDGEESDATRRGAMPAIGVEGVKRLG